MDWRGNTTRQKNYKFCSGRQSSSRQKLWILIKSALAQTCGVSVSSAMYCKLKHKFLPFARSKNRPLLNQVKRHLITFRCDWLLGSRSATHISCKLCRYLKLDSIDSSCEKWALIDYLTRMLETKNWAWNKFVEAYTDKRIRIKH